MQTACMIECYDTNERGGFMSLFLLIFFLLYGGVHVYVFILARNALGFGMAPAVLVGCFMFVMVLAPVLVRLAERRGMEELARLLAHAGYIWMGLLFLFFSASIAIHVYHGVLFVAAKLTQKDLGILALSSRTCFLAALAWAYIASMYGAWEANSIRIERILITTPKLPPKPGKIRIVQISDVHMGLIVREGRIGRIIKSV